MNKCEFQFSFSEFFFEQIKLRLGEFNGIKRACLHADIASDALARFNTNAPVFIKRENALRTH